MLLIIILSIVQIKINKYVLHYTIILKINP